MLNEAADGHNSGHDVPPLHQQQKGIKCTTSYSSCPTKIQAFCKCSEEDAAQPLQQAPELALYMDIISVVQLAGTTTLDQIVNEILRLHSLYNKRDAMTLLGPNYYIKMVVIGGAYGNMEWIFMMVLSSS